MSDKLVIPAGQEFFLPTVEYTRRKATDTLVIHCAETPKTLDIGAAEIRKWHVEENGWKDIGYHVVIRRNGVVEVGRPIWSVGSHVKGHNATSIGVSLVGGCNAKDQEENNFTPEQWSQLLNVVTKLLHTFPITTVCGHRDFPGVTKYCPSFDVKTWMKENKKVFNEQN